MDHTVSFSLRTVALLRTFLVRDRRGAAALEFALGAVVLLATASACFDLYTRISADTAGARMASIMADYVSRDEHPDLAEMTKLGEFLYNNELGVPANLAFVVTAIRKPSGNPPEVLWIDETIKIGDATATQELADACAQHVDGSPPSPVLPGHFTMADDDILIIVEFCARLTRLGALSQQVAGDIYRLYALPARTQGKIPDPPA